MDAAGRRLKIPIWMLLPECAEITICNDRTSVSKPSYLLGWQQVEIINNGLGSSAGLAAAQREGFSRRPCGLRDYPR
jgi:hypothetical protein